MSMPIVPVWKKAPVLRLLLPFASGIIIQWYLPQDSVLLWISLVTSFSIVILFFLFPLFHRFKHAVLVGASIQILFASLGALVCRYNDIRNSHKWFGHYYKKNVSLLVTLQEPPEEKTKSFKANASVDFVLLQDTIIKTSGGIILYFKKDSSGIPLSYGSVILIKKPLQEIKNSGNPAGFNYKRYCLFQDITHQVYLKNTEWTVLPAVNRNPLQQFLISTREKVLQILKKNIPGEKEQGLAEALLIGYKNDLDKTLVQSYSNTGVVHVIAISGLHLGLIYWLLLLLTRFLQKRKNIQWLQPLLIISGLWLFSLLAGAQPSVVRSAVMFTCLVFGESLTRKSSILNTLAFSAFLLLCYNPFWLWDVGFQLSYAAVLSIVLFMKPVYNCFYFKNKILDFIWKLNAVTIAAQLLTLPVSIYHFHQFPNYFLLTNLLAVPLSSLILLGEIFLCAISFIPAVATLMGQILYWLIRFMNNYVEQIERLPFSLWDGLQITIPQAALLLTIVAGLAYWWLEKMKRGLMVALTALAAFFLLRSVSFLHAAYQEKIIVYNVPQKQAIDIIDGRKYLFIGDTDLLADDFIRNFHIKPSRVSHRIEPAAAIESFVQTGKLAVFRNKKILVIDSSVNFEPVQEKLSLDLLVISKNPKLYFKKLTETFAIRQVVFDGSVPSWKMKYWKKDCDSLHIAYHDVQEKGAFVMRMN